MSERKRYDPPVMMGPYPVIETCTTCGLKEKIEPFPFGWMVIFFREIDQLHPKKLTLCPKCSTDYIRTLVTH